MTRFFIILTGLLMLSSLALLAQPSDFERGRDRKGMSLKDVETIEKVGVIQGVVTETPEQPGNRRGGQFQPEEHLFVELYSGERIDIGTKSYWSSKKLNLKTGNSIRFNAIQRGTSDHLMAVGMTYEDNEYDLLDDEGRPVWMKQRSETRRGRGDGSPPGRH